MSFASIFDGIPAWVLVPCAFILIVAALRYRDILALVLTALACSPLECRPACSWPFPFGLLINNDVAVGIAGCSMRAIQRIAAAKAAVMTAVEQARLANEYHRREREGRSSPRPNRPAVPPLSRRHAWQ